ncbi:aldose 1-epimerase [Flavobacterium gillisiae]|uniref:Aldose 1-epimerase n=1 Tax=Flavobacterium gillisiae TaxID=150146 RepID=A0A1H4F8V1_9FLAO|nr:aldose epimerase family protein [Flavobacterium gillisiae]SEA93621.1 aldose 1-epimerase [Flavobacterium gillisiae]
MKTKHISHLISNYLVKFFGLLANGDSVHSCELTNKKGMSLQLIDLGAAVTSLKIPLKNGEVIDVVLGFDTLDDYVESYNLQSAPYFGATVGRFAGRINKGRFVLNGKQTQLSINNGEHSLHGGPNGFSQKIWEIVEATKSSDPSIKLRLISPNNDENFPGELVVELTYTVSEENELIIEYQATTTEDTIINLTHHSYFNLDSHNSSISKQELIINSNKMVETTEDNIPTGTILDVSKGPFDFSTPKKCPSKIDNTFVLESKNEFAASLFNKNNNLKMTVYTNQPGLHIYVGGDCASVLKGKNNADYHPLSGICFETQNFPDAPNHDHFPTAVLKKGEVYHHKTLYKFQSF